MRTNLLLAVVLVAVACANAQTAQQQQCPIECKTNNTNDGTDTKYDATFIIDGTIFVHINVELKFVAFGLKDLLYVLYYEQGIAGVFHLQGIGFVSNKAGYFTIVETELTAKLENFFDFKQTSEFIKSIRLDGLFDVKADLVKTAELLYQIRNFVGQLEFAKLAILKEHLKIAQFLQAYFIKPFTYYQNANANIVSLGFCGLVANVLDIDLPNNEQFGVLIKVVADFEVTTEYLMVYVSYLNGDGQFTTQQLYALSIGLRIYGDFEMVKKAILDGTLKVNYRSRIINNVAYDFVFVRYENIYISEVMFIDGGVSYDYGFIYDGTNFAIVNYESGYAFVILGNGNFAFVHLESGSFYVIAGLNLAASFIKNNLEVIAAWKIRNFALAIKVVAKVSKGLAVRLIDFKKTIAEAIHHRYHEAQEFWAGLEVSIRNAEAAGLEVGLEVVVGALLNFRKGASVVSALYFRASFALIELKGLLISRIVKIILNGFEAFANGYNWIQEVIESISAFAARGYISIASLVQFAAKLLASVKVTGTISWGYSASGGGGGGVSIN